MTTTLAEIASLAGVSTPTVSKVLNGRPGVSDATRDRVGALLEQNGYRKPGTQHRTGGGIVDLVIADLASSWAQRIVVGAEEEATRAGYGLVVTSTHRRRAGNSQWIRNLAQRRSDGVVLVVSDLLPTAEEKLTRLNMPYVLVDSVGSTPPDVPTVAATNWAGGLAATEHLLALGHRRIGIITGPDRLACSRDRLDGYRAALQRAGVDPDPALVQHGDFVVPGGRRGASRLLDLADPPTAIFAGSDHQAHGVYQIAHERGLRIPHDLSVVGFDDVDLCEWVSPTLTTVHQPLSEMAREATRLVVALAEGGDDRRRRVELSTELVVRDSTAPPAR